MTRFLLIGMTAFTMTAGAAFAQISTTETITRSGSSLTINNGEDAQTRSRT